MCQFIVSIITLSLLAACANPLPFGPGRVSVALEAVRIEKVSHGMLFGPMVNPARAEQEDEVLHFEISSEVELLEYFDEWQRQIQVRCAVLGASDGRAYSGYARGLFSGSTDLKILDPARRKDFVSPRADGRFGYSVYAFIDLVAKDDEYRNGSPVGQLDLRREKFDQLNCHLLGVTMAPVIFPRSNSFGVTRQRFVELDEQYRAR